MARIKTRYIGVYYRYGKNRYDKYGRPDKCYDIHIRFKGKDLWEVVGWKSEGFTVDDAIELRNKRVRALRHPELVASSPSTILDDIWERYKNTHLMNLKSPKNIISIYEYHIKSEFGKLNVNLISSYRLELFKNKLLQSLSPGTVKLIFKFLRSLINKGKEWGLVSKEYEMPRKSIAIHNADSKRERFLYPQEVRQILDSLQLYNCKLYYISKIAIYTGMRLGEIVSLDTDNIDLSAKIIYVDGKTGRRAVYISEYIIDDLKYLIERSNKKLLFRTMNGERLSRASMTNIFAKFIKFAGLNAGITDTKQKIVFHTFRHTFCSWLAMKGVPLLTIGQLVGHSSTKMTERYAKLSPDYKRQALEQIHSILEENTKETN